MILQALYEYYQRKAADPGSTIAPHGLEWKEIHCVNKNGEIKSIEEIHEEIYNVIRKVIS